MSTPRDVFRAPTGTHDVLPPASAAWERVVATFARRAERFGYGLLLTPLFEHYEVLQRVGETTDVVRKEMYDFADKGDRRLALRPEGTAPVVRAFVQHRPVVPWKVWYVAPNFRYERPQKGRYRQHWQLGVEVMGVDDPAVDVEVIALAAGFYEEIGLRGATLVINSMGDADSRARYVAVLREHWRTHADVLGDEATRADANPLRVLDAKRDDWREVVDAAPRLPDFLTDASAAHFEAVRRGLTDLGVAFEVAPRLVRGFDYYTGTAFEFRSDALDAAQNAIGGGGRYDGLAEEMGGPPTPGIGFGIGIERMLIALDAETGDDSGSARSLDVFVVDALGDGREASVLVHELREAGLRVDRAFGARSVRKQWGAADRAHARWGVMLAPRELEQSQVIVKDLASGDQCDVHRGDLAAWLTTRHDSGE